MGLKVGGKAKMTEEEKQRGLEVIARANERVNLAIKEHSKECNDPACGWTATMLTFRCANNALIQELLADSPYHPLQTVLSRIARVANKMDQQDCVAMLGAIELLSTFLGKLLSWPEVKDASAMH